MNRISAAENLIIETAPDEWRLLSHENGGQPAEIVHVSTGSPMTFTEDFAQTRRLPTAGRLPSQYIRQVILGWSHEDNAWHLGLLLERELADIRGSRWCELANWPDPDPSVFQNLAEESGQGLAEVLSVPFNVIPPREEEDAPPQAAEQPEAPLPELPLELGTWRLAQIGENRLSFYRTRQWQLMRLVRAIAYGVLAAIYLLLSITTLQGNLALPNSGVLLPSPEMLPYLGIAAAIVSVGAVFYTLYELLIRTDHIVVDGEAGYVGSLRGRRARWQLNVDDIESVYVTHVVRPRRRKPTIRHGEINLYRQDGTFVHVLQQAVRDNEPANWLKPDQDAEESVKPLKSTQDMSHLQAAALHMARSLGAHVPVWYDQRLT